MWFLRLAKLFQTQFLFNTKIKTTNENILPNILILDLSEKQGSNIADKKQKETELCVKIIRP